MGGGGWEEKWRLRLNSAQFQVKLPAGAELGNIQGDIVEQSCNNYVRCAQNAGIQCEIVELGEDDYLRCAQHEGDKKCSIDIEIENVRCDQNESA